MKKNDLINLRFTRLVVVSFSESRDGHTYWLCKCDCGNTKIIKGDNLLRNNSKSCGCLNKELVKKRFTTHGMRHTNEYSIWCSMLSRCYNSNSRGFYDYGERGIFVCDEWRNNFLQFYLDMGPRPSKKHSIDRIDNNDGYYKNNCRWTTNKIQSQNRRSNKILRLNGVSKTISQWSEYLNINCSTILSRLGSDWSIEDTLLKPVRHRS